MGIEVNKIFSLTGHRDSVYAMTPGKGPYVYSSGGDGWIVEWDLRTPDQGQLLAKVDNSVYGMHYNPEKNQLLVGHNQEGLHLINMDTRKEERSIAFTEKSIFDIKSHGKEIFIACETGELVIIDEENWVVKQKLQLARDRIRRLVISYDRGIMAVGTSDNEVHLIDLASKKLFHSWKAHENSVFGMAFSPRNTLITVSRDAHVKEWNLDDFSLVNDVVGHMYAINDVTFHPDGKYFVTCSMDKTIKLWRLEDFRLLKVIDKGRHAGHGTSVNKLYWSAFSDYIVSASDDRTLSVWSLAIND